jgi:hypothetical protein
MAQAVNVGAGAYLAMASGLVILGAACLIRSREDMRPHAPTPAERTPRRGVGVASPARFWIGLLGGLLAGGDAVYVLVGPRSIRERADAPAPRPTER